MSKENNYIFSDTVIIKTIGLEKDEIMNKTSDIFSNKDNIEVLCYEKGVECILKIKSKTKDEDDSSKVLNDVIKKLQDRLGEDIYALRDVEIEEVVAKMLIDKKLTISTAESCTGGLVAGTLINYPGISEVFLEGVVTYTNESKHKRLGVKNDTLNKYGAVSEETAKEMAIGVAKMAGTDTSIVTTGIAGPGGGTEEKPVGLVYIGVYVKGNVKVERHVFKGDRQEVRRAAVVTGIDMLRRILSE